MLQSAAIGAGRNPRFGGGSLSSLSSPRIFLYQSRWKPISSVQTTENKRLQGMLGRYTPSRFFLLHPPFCLCNKKYAVVCNTKNAPNRLPQTGSEKRVARYVE